MNVVFEPNKKTEKILLDLPDDIMYAVARITLDMSMKKVPMSRGKSTSGQLRRSTMAYGVRGSNGDYSIGSSTSYAKYVWVMNNETTNWTTPGTGSQWYINYLKKHGKQLIAESIKENL
jgi:hypothetical protein